MMHIYTVFKFKQQKVRLFLHIYFGNLYNPLANKIIQMIPIDVIR